MTDEQPGGQDFEHDYQNLVENPQQREQLQEWNEKEKKHRLIIFITSVFFLFLSRFGQFG